MGKRRGREGVWRRGSDEIIPNESFFFQDVIAAVSGYFRICTVFKFKGNHFTYASTALENYLIKTLLQNVGVAAHGEAEETQVRQPFIQTDLTLLL